MGAGVCAAARKIILLLPAAACRCLPPPARCWLARPAAASALPAAGCRGLPLSACCWLPACSWPLPAAACRCLPAPGCRCQPHPPRCLCNDSQQAGAYRCKPAPALACRSLTLLVQHRGGCPPMQGLTANADDHRRQANILPPRRYHPVPAAAFSSLPCHRTNFLPSAQAEPRRGHWGCGG